MADLRKSDESFLYGTMELGRAHDSVVAVKRKAYSSSAVRDLQYFPYVFDLFFHFRIITRS